MKFEEFIQEWRNEHPYILVKTSGSTGSPKEISLEKGFMRDSALRTIDFFGLNSASRLHSCVSPDFIGGKMMAVRAELIKANLTWEEPSNTPLKDFPVKKKIDLLAIVPSQMIHILDNIQSMPEIKNIIIGGSAIHPDLRKKIALSGLNAFETYGMTETASHIALRKVKDSEEPFSLLPGISVEVDSNDCLVILFSNGKRIETNDLTTLVSPSQFYIRGRFDNMIISGGKKINPYELEKRISSLISSPFYVTGVPDEKWGEKTVLVIEGEKLCVNDIKNKLREVLQNWELPKEIITVEKIPRTSNGKIIQKLGNGV